MGGLGQRWGHRSLSPSGMGQNCHRSRERCCLHSCWGGKGWGGGSSGSWVSWPQQRTAGGDEESLTFVLPSPLPATRASVSPVTEGLCWGMGAMEEVDEASERCPRDTRHCACSHLGPLSSVCPPRGTGDPLPFQGNFARSGR